ncbi:MAG: hypothetical protein ACOC23_09115 [Thermodesulfobacteriota bacterium]
MTDGWTAALEASAAAVMLRNSVWAYPLVNAGHILGVALLIGAIIPLDLRLLGLWRSVPVAPLRQVLRPTAAVGLGMAVFFGSLLFITRATEYAASPLFISKMVVVGTGILNALAVQTILPENRLLSGRQKSGLPIFRRLAAGVSLGAWLTALLLGRLVGYF